MLRFAWKWYRMCILTGQPCMPSFIFFQKAVFGQRYFFVFKNPHWLTVCKVFDTQPNSLQLLFFWKHDLFINHFLNPLYHFDTTWFLFCMFAKTPIYNIWYVFTQINLWHGVYEMGMLVLSNIFCIFSRNTKLSNFVNIFREKYISNFYKQGVIWKVIQFRKLSCQLFPVKCFYSFLCQFATLSWKIP